MGPWRDAITALWALVAYRRRVLPAARAELERWRKRAAAIPDPALRAAAVSALRDKDRNVEAIAVFAILAPRARRAEALRAMTALQVAVDYLDSLGEEPVDDPLADGLRLHGALRDAVSPGSSPGDWYGPHRRQGDGGYLGELVAACQAGLAALPAVEPVSGPLRRAAQRCGEGQSHTHAAGRGGAGIEAWAESQEGVSGFLWWEVAAGASSSVAAHALIAAAADPRTSAEEAALIDAAYFPPIGALTVLLDDLVDRDEDRAAGEHNYLDHCAGPEEAAERIGLLASRARAATARLRHSHRHRAILSGVLAFYLAAAPQSDAYARPIRERLLEANPAVRPLMAALTRSGRT